MNTPIIILTLMSLPLTAAYLHARFTSTPLHLGKYASWGLGLAFIFFFIGHFLKTDGMVEMLPTWIPLRLELVYLTGILELLIGIALLTPKYQIAASKVAIAVLVVFFPVNIYAAVNSIGLGGHQWGPVYLLVRTPLQIILISWAYFFCIKHHEKMLNSEKTASDTSIRMSI